MAKKKPFNRVIQELKKQDWTGHFIELIIVIFGIFIAFQLAMIGERKGEVNQYKALVSSVRLENEKNREEFEELRAYRSETVTKTMNLLRLLNNRDSASMDSIQYYIFTLNRISTPDLQLQAIQGLINSTFPNANLELKNEAIRLKALYDEWLLSSESFSVDKQNKFFVNLYESVDFYKGEIIDFKTIFSLPFKNNVLEIYGDEKEQTRLYHVTFEQFEKFDKIVREELK